MVKENRQLVRADTIITWITRSGGLVPKDIISSRYWRLLRYSLEHRRASDLLTEDTVFFVLNQGGTTVELSPRPCI